MEFKFNSEEVLFYAVLYIIASIAGMFRIWRDNEVLDLRTICGRSFSSGVLGFGVVGFCLGGDSSNAGGSGGVGVFYWLAIAALVGYCSRDLQDQILARLIKVIMRIVGGIGGNEDGTKPGA